jgi:hypothetical protein
MDTLCPNHERRRQGRTREGVELQPDAQLADGLALDEGTTDVGVLDQPLPVRDAGGLGISDGSRRARLKHRDHQIRFRGKLAGERTPSSTRTECKRRPEIMVSGRAR